MNLIYPHEIAKSHNYDDVLEQYLSKSNIKIRHRSVYSSAIMHSNNEIPIYHVHGFLPQKGKSSSDYVIFSEYIYHQQYKDPINWNSFIQINKFMNFTCLFIGVSFTDPNLRRLLDIAKNLKGESNLQHYIIRKKYDLQETQKKLQILLESDEDLQKEKLNAELDFSETGKELIEIMKNYQENDSASFDVGTIWVNNYAEVPDILKQISI